MKTSTVIKSWLIALLLTATAGAQALDVNVNALDAHQHETNIHHDDDDPKLRDIAAQSVHWLRPGPVANPESWLKVKILGINDFHGQLSAGRLIVTGEPPRHQEDDPFAILGDEAVHDNRCEPEKQQPGIALSADPRVVGEECGQGQKVARNGQPKDREGNLEGA